MNFTLNQIFDNTYPPEAAVFCNKNNYVIKEISSNGKRQFQIQEIPAPSEEDLFQSLRSERNSRIAEFDFMFNSDYPDSEYKEQVKAYRQALRDLPSQEGAPWTPDTIPWPEKP